MKSYYVFKLNIQPNILAHFTKSNELEYLISEVIPNSFELIMEVKENKGIFQMLFEDVSEINFEEKFKELEDITNKLIKEYKNILQDYQIKGEIYYSKEFLKLNDKCGNLRRYIESEFSGLKKAYEIITDDEVEKEYDLVTDNQVGTSITHIKKFYKLKIYISTDESISAITPLNLNAFYNPKTEHILVEADKEDEARNYIDAFIRVVNNNKEVTQSIGKININPIYESISLEGNYSEISYTLVYPNGNPPLNRNNILEQSQAKEQHTTLIGTDGKPLNTKPVQDILEEQGKKGYLKSLIVKGYKSTKSTISKLKNITNMSADT